MELVGWLSNRARSSREGYAVAGLVNPYIAGAPVTEARMFFGREDVFQWIENSMTGQYGDHILVIHGQRRVGKTSVLKQLGNRLPKRYLPVFFDLQGRTHTTLDRFLWWLSREIVRVLRQERGLEIPLPAKDDFSADSDFFEGRFLPQVSSLLPDDTLLLTFDEFDNLEESEVKETLAAPLTDYLRRLMGRERLNFIYSIGSSGRKLENMKDTYTSFFKTALYKKISFLSEEQTHSLVTRPVEGVLEYNAEAVDRIYSLASGHPYFTQLTCHEIFARCQRTEQRSVSRSDVDEVLDDVVERGTVNLKFTWDEASDIEKWSLAGLAHLEKHDTRALADYLRKQRVRFSEADLTSGLLHLREKDVLTSGNDFVIDLLRLWLQKNRSMEQVREQLTEVNPIANRYIEIGLEYRHAGQYDKAIESFQEALEISKGNLQAQVSIALTYMDQQAFSQAVVEFEKALALDDEDISSRAGLCEAHLALGDGAMSKGHVKEAVQSYQRVLAINAEHTEARGRMAEWSRQRAEKLLGDAKDEEALAAFTEALKYTPEDPVLVSRVETVRKEKKVKLLAALLARADKEAGARNWEAAIKLLEEAVRLAPEDGGIRLKLEAIRDEDLHARLSTILVRARAAAQAGRFREAAYAFDEYLAIHDDEAIRRELEETRLAERQNQLETTRVQARALVKSEKYAEALSAWQQYLALDPPDAAAVPAEIAKVEHRQRISQAYFDGQNALAHKEYDRAIGLFKSIIVEDEDYRDATHLMAQAIELRRKVPRWWQARWIWAVPAAIVLMAVAWFAWPPVSRFLAGMPSSIRVPTVQSTDLPVSGLARTPASTPVSTATALQPPPTAMSLEYQPWERLSSTDFLKRDQINAIVIDSTVPGVMYAATEHAGVYKSIDGGITWRSGDRPLENPSVDSLVMDPADAKVLYAGTRHGGVYKTTDGGESWSPVNNGIPIASAGGMAILAMNPRDPAMLFFTDGQRIYMTKNGGGEWEPVFTESDCPREIKGLAINPQDPEMMFATGGMDESCNHLVYVSDIWLRSWKPLGLALPDSGNYFKGLWVAPQQGKHLYVRVGGPQGDTLWLSPDAGASWQVAWEGGSCHSLAFASGNDYKVACGVPNGVWYTDNAWDSSTWHQLGMQDYFGQITALAFSPDNAGVLYMGGRSFYRWDIQGSAPDPSYARGLGSYRLELLINRPAEPGAIFATHGPWDGMFVSTDQGKNWREAGTSPLAFKADRTVLGVAGGRLQNSTDDALTWDSGPSIPGVERLQSIAAHPYLLNLYFALYAGGIRYSRDAGETWEDIKGLQQISDPRLFFDYAQGLRVYAVGDQQVYRSDSYGMSWERCGELPVGTWISSYEMRAAVGLVKEDHVFIATRGRGILFSEDGCRTWETLNNNLGSLYVNTIAVRPGFSTRLWAATDGGAYYSLDRGYNWSQVNNGLLGTNIVYSIVVDKGGQAYASTPSGVYRLVGLDG